MKIEDRPIGELVDRCQTWDPRADGSGTFQYIDLSSIDKDSKKITTIETFPCAEAPSRARQLVKTDDVLVATVRPNLNGVALCNGVHEGMTASTGYCVLRPKKDKLDARYLFQWVKTETFVGRMVSVATGANYPAVSDGKVKESTIPLPALAEQKRIAGILDAADALRAKRRESLASADHLITCVFYDLFGEPVKLPSTWAAQEAKSVGWSKCTIGDQLMLQRGKDITKSIAKPGSVPVISSGGVSFYHDEAFARGPGVLLGRKGSVGNVHYVESDYWPHDTTLYVRDFKGNLPLFVYHFFLRFPISHYEASAANPSLNRNNVHPVSVHWPSKDLQEKFVSIVKSVERQKVRMKDHLAELDALFASLQSRAFRGEL